MFLFDLFLHSFLLLLLPVVDLALAESTDCYYPNGKLSRDTAACYSEFLGPTGLCCKPGDLCLNNTLCAMKFTGNHMSYYRGTCLDATWSNPSCPDFCLGSSRKPQALVPVFPCEDDETGKQWYCGDHGPPDKKGSCELFHGSFALSRTPSRMSRNPRCERADACPQRTRTPMPSQAQCPRIRPRPVQPRRARPLRRTLPRLRAPRAAWRMSRSTPVPCPKLITSRRRC